MPVSTNRRGNGKLKPRARSAIHMRRFRTKAEIAASAQYRLTFRMIEAIGPSPVYRGSWRGSPAEKAWAQRAEEWIKANQKRAA